MSKLSDVIGRGVLASRPAAGSAGRLYEATDSTPPTVYRDNGSSWDTFATAGAATVTTTRGDLIVRGASADQRLALGASGKVLTSDGTDAVWGNGPMTTKGDIMAGAASGAITRVPIGTDGYVLTADAASTPGLKWAAASGGGGTGGLGEVEVAYAEQTTIVTISATTEAGSNTVVTAPAFTADGSSTYVIEFYAPFVRSGTNGLLWVVLFEDGTAIGAELLQGGGAIGDHYSAGSTMRRKRTPTAASHTYSIRAYRATANGEVGAGAGVAGDYVPAYVRITKLNVPGLGVFAGAKAYSNATQAVTTGADRVITFNAEDWDTDAFHDNSTNPGRFTVPAGKGGKYNVVAHVYGLSGSNHDVRFRLNGTSLYSDVLYTAAAGAAITLTAVFNLVAGDYVEVVINPGANVTLGHASAREAQNDMSVTLIGGVPTLGVISDAHGARVTRSANQSVGNNTLTAVSFTAEDYDTDAIHDNSTNPTRLTIPTIAGVATGLWAIKGLCYTDVALADIMFKVNGTTSIGFTRMGNSSLGAVALAVDYVFAAGDYVEMFVRTPSGAGNVSFDAGVSPVLTIAFHGKVT